MNRNLCVQRGARLVRALFSCLAVLLAASGCKPASAQKTLVKTEFTPELVATAYQALCGDAEPFGRVESKADVRNQITDLQNLLPEQDAAGAAALQAEIAALTAQLSTLPEEQWVPGDVANIRGYYGGEIMCDIGRAEPAYFSMHFDGRYLEFLCESGSETGDHPVTKRRAKQEAEAVLDTMGVGDDFILDRIERAVDEAAEPDGLRQRKTYYLDYLRKSDAALPEAERYAVSERLWFVIGDAGIERFTWEWPRAETAYAYDGRPTAALYTASKADLTVQPGYEEAFSDFSFTVDHVAWQAGKLALQGTLRGTGAVYVLAAEVGCEDAAVPTNDAATVHPETNLYVFTDPEKPGDSHAIGFDGAELDLARGSERGSASVSRHLSEYLAAGNAVHWSATVDLGAGAAPDALTCMLTVGGSLSHGPDSAPGRLCTAVSTLRKIDNG